jgi:hypothetical protein
MILKVPRVFFKPAYKLAYKPAIQTCGYRSTAGCRFEENPSIDGSKVYR